MTAGLKWKVDRGSEAIVVAFAGSIDEDARLDTLTGELSGAPRLRFDMGGITRINSCGVREWVNFMRAIPPGTRATLENCPSVVVAQVNMISNFSGPARVASVRVPYVCKDCGFDAELPMDTPPGARPVLPAMQCPRCKKSEFIFDDLADSYFAFLT
ncbi:MAG: hypothetical protein ACAI38_03280 [Myxococcota bacterium]|nr:hypothetical protein [Myxococcota bacterium]